MLPMANSRITRPPSGKRVSSFLAAAIVLAATLILPSTGRAAVAPVQEYSVTPDTALPGKAIDMTLLSKTGWGCGTVFSHQSAQVTDKRIDLVFVATGPDSLRPCVYAVGAQRAQPANPALVPYNYGPHFTIAALAAGQYEVWAAQMPECAFANPSPCKIAIQPKFAGTLTVLANQTITYSINPTNTAAGKDFTLDLLSYQFNCGTTYDMLSASVNGNAISLTFLDHAQATGAVCPDIYRPYGPAFKMSALKAGSYTVKAFRLPACAAQHCPYAALPGEDAGILKVTDPSRTGWFLKDNQVPPEKPFAMQLLNNAYGNCGVHFTHQSVTVSGGQINANFLVETDTSIECFADIHPNGPTFDMAGLKPGLYPVYVTTYAACEFATPRCEILRIMPQVSDTLLVTNTDAVLFHGSVRGAASAPSAAFAGHRLNLILPAAMGSNMGGAGGPAGIWKVELMNMSGQVLESHRIDMDAAFREGGALGLDIGSRSARGLYMVRLIAPIGVTYSLPVVRKD